MYTSLTCSSSLSPQGQVAAENVRPSAALLKKPPACCRRTVRYIFCTCSVVSYLYSYPTRYKIRSWTPFELLPRGSPPFDMIR